MPEQVWYRSLYWRIALGFVALLATLLLVQGTVFLWMTGRMTDFFPSRSSAQLASTVAADVAAALTEDPDLDLTTFVRGRYTGAGRSFAIVLRDGRMAISERVPPPPQLARAARGRLFFSGAGDRDRDPFRGGPPPPPPGGFGAGGDPGPGPGPRNDRGRGGDRFDGGRGGRRGDGFGPGGPGGPPMIIEFADINVAGAGIGVVAVPRDAPPFSLALRDLGPTLALVAASLLIAGTGIAALVIFRPTRRRLQALQDAARAIGAGATGVRAPERGRDEVSSVARAFNDMAAQLEERTSALEQADRTRRQLLADVSHELMTPLSAIRGYVETLRMSDLRVDDATRSRYLRIVNEESERLEHIIGDLLDLARLEGGGGTLKMEPLPIAQLMQRVRHRHGPVVAEKSISLETVEDPSVPTIHGDQNRLEQALQNLVANAVRHTPAGGRVIVRSEARPDDRVAFVVEDTGPGIPAEHLGRVFDRFYKVDESRSGTLLPSGSGLGLSIVRAIVTRHGGTVSVSNVDDGGARFEILLPRFTEPSAAAPLP